MEPLALLRSTKEWSCNYVLDGYNESTTEPAGALFMVMRATTYLNWDGSKLINCLYIYPFEKHIRGSNIFRYKNPGDRCSYIKDNQIGLFELLTPNKLIIKYEDKDEAELTNGEQGTIIIKSLIKPEDLPKHTKQFADTKTNTPTGYTSLAGNPYASPFTDWERELYNNIRRT